MDKDVNEQETSNNSGEAEILQALLESSNKQLRLARIRTIFVAIMSCAIVIALLAIVPKVVALSNEASDLMAQASEVIDNANTAIDELNEMSASISSMGTNVDKVITENADAMAEVVQKMNDVDFESLNNGIQDFVSVIEPMSKFFGKR